MGKSTGAKEGGFVLVWALLLMVVLLILGVSGIGTSVFESMMTANDALHKQSFFQADGGANTATVLIEENVSCPQGFNSGLPGLVNGTVQVSNPLLYNNTPPANLDLPLTGNRTYPPYPNVPLVPVSDTPTTVGPFAGNGGRDAYYFPDLVNDPTGTVLQRTNIKTYGTTKVLPGGPLEMAAGYEGRGKGLPGGGAAIDYDTFSQYINVRQSQSVTEIMWQHLIGFEGTCRY